MQILENNDINQGTSIKELEDISTKAIPDPTKKCASIAEKAVNIYAPVTITPNIDVKTDSITVKCCTAPYLLPILEDTDTTFNDSVSFAVVQRVCVSIPIDFSANVEAGPGSVEIATEPVPEEGTNAVCSNCPLGGCMCS